jgi:hypothetical protein
MGSSTTANADGGGRDVDVSVAFSWKRRGGRRNLSIMRHSRRANSSSSPNRKITGCGILYEVHQLSAIRAHRLRRAGKIEEVLDRSLWQTAIGKKKDGQKGTKKIEQARAVLGNDASDSGCESCDSLTPWI